MTARQQAFLDGLQALINEYDAEWEITDDEKPWGMGIVKVFIPGEGAFRLPTYMDAEASQ